MTAQKALLLSNAGFSWDASHIRRVPRIALEEESEEE